jgi:tRNA threonylcarbamoyladenosine biosynthesis protein TsaB
MPKVTLVIDTCLGACQVAVARGTEIIAGRSELMERGQQERLGPMTREALEAAGADPGDVDRIAVTIGPGSFTGLRVGLAFAQGWRMATGAPLVGLGTLEALAASAAGDGGVASVIDARRDRFYWQAFEDGLPLTEPQIASPPEIAARLGQIRSLAGWRLIGPGAPQAQARLGAAEAIKTEAPALSALIRLAARKEASHALQPLYLRAPDAQPAAR